MVQKTVKPVEVMYNYHERTLTVTLDGQGGKVKSVSASCTPGQCQRAH